MTRLIAFAVLILAGGVLFSAGTIADALTPLRGQTATLLGCLIMIAGGFLFAVEFCVSLRERQ